MQMFFILILVVDIFILAVSRVTGQAWALDICQIAMGVCEYPVELIVLAVVCFGLVIVVRQ